MIEILKEVFLQIVLRNPRDAGINMSEYFNKDYGVIALGKLLFLL